MIQQASNTKGANRTHNMRFYSFAFTGKERDSETGYSYFGARYYDSDLSGLFLSVDPMADKYPSISPYAYCAWNPLKLVDPNGKEVADYYDKNGRWLGTDGENDNIAYVAKSVSKNSKGLVVSAVDAQQMSITNEELLDRAAWVCGESGGSSEIITQRTQNVGDASNVSDATVADYYAFAINNAVKRFKTFDKAAKILMKKIVKKETISTYDGYFTGTGKGGNSNSKAFANARANGYDNLNNDTRFTNSIAAVIRSVSGNMADPTGGCRGWLGSISAEKYYRNPDKHCSQAVLQFSFSSSSGRYFHTFFTSGR